MSRETEFRGKTKGTGQWVYGSLVQVSSAGSLAVAMLDDKGHLKLHEIIKGTEGQYTGLNDRDGQHMYPGDITELEVDGIKRHFVVKAGTVVRDLKSHPNFIDDSAKVSITGIYFEWQEYQLFPCIDSNGIPDNEKMLVIGNVNDNPELLEVANR
ncbi:hypothetical protein A8L34_22415 [Bacillus sp. FJAT-27264]|uniref:YopX family protein n=1 Tax=Paenibacillus sp. (strain DSM 101736 / FJAT-27264) TaxID=1850362 RepID=UPI000808094A|nr:YopX family protein [Bacillus sp. FJAT-27264]OBZ08910.1 hypothetical protein A8L34_22415 [Bacillus sp. FJAT-27264]